MNGEYQIEEPKFGRKKITLLVLVLLTVVALSFVVYFFIKINKPFSFENQPVNFFIDKGEGTKQIANSLVSERVINNSFVFEVYVWLNKVSGKVQAGEYLLNRNMSIAEIVDVLTKGKVVLSDRNVTIIEGWTNKQIEQYLVSRGIASGEQFSSALQQLDYDFKFGKDAEFLFTAAGAVPGKNYQGFLFPDTYRLGKEAAMEELITKMLKNFESKFTAEMQAAIANNNWKLSDVIILASIIEKEVGRNKEVITEADQKAMQRERELVASVFYNRLKIEMALESDATVNYVTGKSDRSVTLADTKINSPYNTYKNIGLPPAPICNPGLGSILAAINPVTSDYLFFLNKPTGEAVFSKTLSEHNTNKAKFLK